MTSQCSSISCIRHITKYFIAPTPPSSLLSSSYACPSPVSLLVPINLVPDLCLHRVLYKQQDRESRKDAWAPHRRFCRYPHPWKRSRLIRNYEVKERPHLWCHQHHRQLRHCVPGPGLLAACHCQSPCEYRQGLPSWWSSLVGRFAISEGPSLTHAGDRFAIPFTFATTLGLAAVALRGDPAMKVLSPADVSAGLPAAAAAAALLGKAGAAAILVLLFLAVTSACLHPIHWLFAIYMMFSGACSAELIAVSSLLTYDVYKVSLLSVFLGT